MRLPTYGSNYGSKLSSTAATRNIKTTKRQQLQQRCQHQTQVTMGSIIKQKNQLPNFVVCAWAVQPHTV